MIKSNISASEAVKVDQLCGRILGDIGSIHARISPQAEDGSGSALAMPAKLVALRRYIREVSDAVRDAHPNAFFK